MIINHNLSAIFAQRQLSQTGLAIDKNMEKLASGLRITRAGDDASGLAVSEKMRSQIRGLQMASMNAENGISFIQVSEGYLDETTQVLQRMRELGVQAANGIYTAEDRMQIQVEVSQLVQEVGRIASSAEFNRMKMLTGGFAVGKQTLYLHVGANMDQRVGFNIGDMSAKGLGVTTSSVRIDTPDSANKALGAVDAALTIVNKQRADLGAYQNRLEKTVQGLSVAAENMQAAESRIRDANMASEMVDYVKNQILQRSGTAMLSQANLKPQTVLELLR